MQDVLDSLPFVEFGGFKLAKRSVYDRARYLREVRDAGRLRLLEDLKAAGVTGRDMLNELRAFDAGPWGGSQAWISFVISIDGAPKIFTDAAESFQPGKGEEVARRLCFESEDQRTQLLMDLCGLKFSDPTPPPATTATPEGTDPTPTGSESNPSSKANSPTSETPSPSTSPSSSPTPS